MGTLVKAEGVTTKPGHESMALMAIIERAATDPAFDVDKLQALLAVKERWEAGEAKKAYVAALNAFKADAPELTKNKHVKFGATEYDHATLDHVSLAIGKALSAHGLTHRWDIDHKDNAIIVSCVLTHVAGHSERVTMPPAAPDTSGSKNSIQALGSTITYLQRYSLLAATGMAVKGQDDDGNAAGGGIMPENMRMDFEAAIDSQVDAESLAALWKDIATACKTFPKDMNSYNILKSLVAAKGKELKAAGKGDK